MAQAGAIFPHPSRPDGLVLLLIGLCALCGEESHAGRILVYPVDGSHWLNMDVLLRELHRRGHVLTVVRSSTSWYIPENSAHFSSVTVPLQQAINLENPEYMAYFLQRNLDLRRGSVLSFLGLQRELMSMLSEAHRSSAQMVRLVLENSTLVEELKRARFDLMLTDPGFAGGVVLGRYLGLPMVFNVRWITNGDGHFAIAPSPLSYVPTIGSQVSDCMSFANKLKNLLHFGIGVYLDLVVARPHYQGVCDEFLGGNTNVYELIQSADLWLMRVDFVFEFPRPTMPNVVYMGGFQCRPAQPLPPELEEFVQSSGEHGVVLMSLGTLLGGLQPHISEVIASAFARLPQKVVWRHLGARPSTLGNNTLLLDWLPQNDLLGHPKTRAFVTHGGTNGLYEAIYHGVPVLGLPLIFDQKDNMVRVDARGAGIVLDVTVLEVDSLTQALRDVLDEQKPYRENMRRLSRLHHDRPLEPLDSALFWMEFVMRHGGAAHLRTESYRMPWYAYHNLDVLALLLGSATALLVLIGATCRCLFQRLCRTRKVKLQ
ncbi:UDP glucuronosyltransferase 5 family, polypeptide E1 [Anguilla anguilla]|uniref:UDP glucuronosyltransferase 5 family, polypeptide E1 n=1 Tax=Anguilla anguilla TaxID=7936 RepID=UPI0015A79DC0|nr:UDP glucuronosyltransferase 5 family, polypeptide E1 [Anguilla anguilla]XP_035237354.1 UDP glucuronosyltransferase 5 family, polypeptide E1 [Anguilla anguilla]XP_035237355.1 UDP glucuronosyltransferase 5 family, polypeptide E1 [Anguilla anguilla]